MKDALRGVPVLSRVGGQAQEDLAGEGVIARVQRLQVGEQVRQVGIPGQASEQDLAGG